jgi:hypothetical protein
MKNRVVITTRLNATGEAAEAQPTRHYDCAMYSECLMAAALRNDRAELCSSCERYCRLHPSAAVLDRLCWSSKADYVQYELS